MRRNRLVAAVAAVVLVAGVIVGVRVLTRKHAPVLAYCDVASPTGPFELDPDQAANAATIAAAARMNAMPDHAVTVAIAAALQESHLHNLPYGDRDSLGLFQQRPSQGWGTRAQLMTPTYAAGAFYRALAHVPNWEERSVNDAAQRVQRSGAPTEYAKWEDEARAVASALTGEHAAALACRFDLVRSKAPPPDYERAFARDRGPLAQVSGARDTWAAAAWLVAHAQPLRIASVETNGQRWTASAGRWQPSRKAAIGLSVAQE
jgi:hypothetical protein